MAHFSAQMRSGGGFKPWATRTGTKKDGIDVNCDASQIGLGARGHHHTIFETDSLYVTFDGGTNGDPNFKARIAYTLSTVDKAPLFEVDPKILKHMAPDSWRAAAQDEDVAAIIRRLFLTDGKAIFERTAARLLLEAYAKAERASGAVSLEDLNDAWRMAKLELPGEYQLMLHELDEETSDA